MTTPSLDLRSPAVSAGSSWRPSYLHRLTRSIKKSCAHITRVLFGCNHGDLTEVVDQRQSCLDCGAWRDVLAARDGRAAYTSRWRPAQSKPAELLAITLPPSLDRLVDGEARDAAFIKLLFAAKRLAKRQLADDTFGGAFCRECRVHSGGGAIAHAPTCDAGVVFSAIAELAAQVPEPFAAKKPLAFGQGGVA
jgi:hypothetical protein